MSALTMLGGCASFLALGRRASLRSLTLALVLAIASVAVYSLSTRLVPDHFGSYDPIAGYRLAGVLNELFVGTPAKH